MLSMLCWHIAAHHVIMLSSLPHEVRYWFEILGALSGWLAYLIVLYVLQLGMAQTLLEGQWADQQQPWGWQGKNDRKLQSFLPGLDNQVSHPGIACT